MSTPIDLYYLRPWSEILQAETALLFPDSTFVLLVVKKWLKDKEPITVQSAEKGNVSAQLRRIISSASLHQLADEGKRVTFH